MQNYKEIITHSGKQTQDVGEAFAKTFAKGTCICLYGNLGAGKTTFTQGLAKGLGIKKRIISPTFTIIRSYQISTPIQSGSNSQFYHVDLYRLSGEADIEATGLLEILQDTQAIIVIEWPDRLGQFLPKKHIEIRLETLGEKKREITYKIK